MENLQPLSKVSKILGLILFYLLIVISCLVVVVYNISNFEDAAELSTVIGSFLGNILAIVLIYFFWRTLFRPIYGLSQTIKMRTEGQLSEKKFRSKWIISLICSGVFGVLFIIGTFGLSFIFMIPQYFLLAKSKNL